MATETMRRDVNAEFASEKLNQLATVTQRREWLKSEAEKGNLRLQGDRYIVLKGWDRGESFSAKTTQPEHGLDLKEDGTAALYLKDRKAWHSAGTVIKGGSSNAETVLNAAGMNWRTLMAPATVTLPVLDTDGTQTGTITRDVPDKFVTYRSDNLNPLGIVGKIYAPVHNVDAFNFLDDLFGDHLMIAESAGSFRDGRRVFISAKLPEDLIIDPDGVADHVEMFVVLINSHDGTTPFKAVMTPWRPVCRNTERLALRDAKTSWTVRHTKNARNKIEEAKRTLGLATQYADEFLKEESGLLTVDFSGNDVDALIAEIWGEKPGADDTERAKTMYANRRDAVHAIFKAETEIVGKNAYAAERAVTGFVDHFAELRPRGALKGNRLGAEGVAVLEGTFDEPKAVAHKKLMTLVRR